MVSAIYMLEQAEYEGLFDTEDRHTRKFNFSHLYTALSRSQYMEYLGLGVAWARHDPDPNQGTPRGVGGASEGACLDLRILRKPEPVNDFETVAIAIY